MIKTDKQEKEAFIRFNFPVVPDKKPLLGLIKYENRFNAGFCRAIPLKARHRIRMCFPLPSNGHPSDGYR